MDKKYEILMDTEKTVEGRVLHRIKALRDFDCVKTGDVGGWIEFEKNLSQEGESWIYDDACVYENACIYDNARIYGNAFISGHTRVCGNAQIYGKANISGEVTVDDQAHVGGYACISDFARIYQNAIIAGYAKIYGRATIYEDALVTGEAKICENARIHGDVVITRNAYVSGDMDISGNTTVTVDLSKNLKESIRCQTGLGVLNNKVIAYKQVNKDLSSLHDPTFYYTVGEVVETLIKEKDLDKKKSCGTGLHFSNMNYWNNNCDIEQSTFLIAEIDLDDIIAVQSGKIRCKRAKILGTYEI